MFAVIQSLLTFVGCMGDWLTPVLKAKSFFPSLVIVVDMQSMKYVGGGITEAQSL